VRRILLALAPLLLAVLFIPARAGCATLQSVGELIINGGFEQGGAGLRQEVTTRPGPARATSRLRAAADPVATLGATKRSSRKGSPCQTTKSWSV
jgi:hypothetical protein